MDILTELPIKAWIIAAVLFLLFLYFIVRFLVYGIRQRATLRRVIRELQGVSKKAPSAFATIFERNEKLAHVWRQYSETLHGEEELNVQTGRFEIIKYRSTVPAEVFFSGEVLVDTVLRSEFFKHLPGIFTGIGIIGTFFGLVVGLEDFQISENATQVRNGLNALRDAVGGAFKVSRLGESGYGSRVPYRSEETCLRLLPGRSGGGICLIR